MPKHRKSIELRLEKIGTDKFRVYASTNVGVYTYRENPIGIVAKDKDGIWRHSSPTSPHLGAVFGVFSTKAKAVADLYRAHKDWVGY